MANRREFLLVKLHIDLFTYLNKRTPTGPNRSLRFLFRNRKADDG